MKFLPACGLILPGLLALAACGPQPEPDAAPDASEAAPALEVSLTPRLPDGEVDAIDIVIHVPAPGASADEPFLSMAIVRAMAPGALDDPSTLVAADERGVIPMTIEEDPVDPSAFRQDRRWLPRRATQGDVTVRYSIEPREITAATRPGPLYDTRTEGAGFYGSGHTMLALPVEGWPRRVRVNWDLSEMPAGARGATSFGEGTAETDATRQNLDSTFFMAGPLNSQPEDGEGDFVVYWITPAAFDLEGAARWTEEAYRYFTRFFGESGSAFRVFMRTTERFQGGGSGGFNSFIFGTVKGEERDPVQVRSLLAHEAIHHFVGGLGEAGGGGAGQQWYSEGATSYYTIVLPRRAGLSGIDRYLEAFNQHALSYYTNPRSNLSNEEVTRLFFSDSYAQIVPYNRGPLYFALVDARMREATDGGQRVDDVIFRFIEGRDSAPDPVSYWRRLLVDALGEKGGAEFDAMMAGEPLDLPSDLFGPCFAAQERMLRNFSLGFRPYEDEEGATRAGPITPGSPADVAGLERYDVIANPEVLAAAEDGPEGATITLDILRDGAAMTVALVPWSEPSPGKQWTRTDVPEARCDL